MSGPRVLGTLRFEMRDQQAFAAWSGDHNPMHMDARAALRRFPGEPIVHGIHVALRALELYATAGPGLPGGMPPARPRGIDLTFVRPVLLDEDVSVVALDDDVMRVERHGEPLLVLRLRADLRHRSRVEHTEHEAADAPDRTPEHAQHWTFAELAGQHGLVAVAASVAALESGPGPSLEAVSAWLGPATLAELATVSTLVGMRCPGEQAVLAEVSVDLADPPVAVLPATARGLGFTVLRTVPAFQRVELAVTGASLHGKVAAFVTPEAPTPGTDVLRSLVAPDRFAGDRPLVVGGSRGLGAVAARLLAMGGADVLIGFHRGSDEAAALVERIVADGGRASAVRIDVTDVAAAVRELDAHGWDGQHVHYMATPRILRRHLGVLRPELLDELTSVYADGFAALVTALLARRPGRPLHVGYPSSVAVDDPPADMLEYALAKSAGERQAQRLMDRSGLLDVHVLRLPRIETEQTVSFARAQSAPAEAVLLAFLTQVHALVPPRPAVSGDGRSRQ
jgi:acyl dehydratase/NAD(P)-dependent dehydrogenase (short-subunit alcohol dehydrogenase family)